MNTYQLQDILDSASKFSKETVQLAAEFIDSMPYNERYPLHYAIYILDMEQVKDLLTEYSTINERDSSYWTPLHIACLIGSKGEKETRAQVSFRAACAPATRLPRVTTWFLLLCSGGDGAPAVKPRCRHRCTRHVWADGDVDCHQQRVATVLLMSPLRAGRLIKAPFALAGLGF